MRKIIYTKALIDLIAGCIFDGLTDSETALLAKVPVKQISRLRLGEDCPEIRESTIQRMRKYIALIRDGEDRSNRWQRIAWFLERRYPDRWAKPEVLLNINSSGANVTNNTLVITAEQAQGLRNRNATIDEALSKLSPPSARAAMTDVMTNVMTNDSASPKSLEIKAGASNCELLAEEFLPNKEHAEKTLSSSVVLAEGATAPARTPDAGAGESDAGDRRAGRTEPVDLLAQVGAELLVLGLGQHRYAACVLEGVVDRSVRLCRVERRPLLGCGVGGVSNGHRIR